MKYTVAYASKTGNTKKVAEAMAEALGIKARQIDGFDPTEPCDLLFLGGAVYKSDLSPEMKSRIDTLDPKNIARVAVFCTSVMGEKANGLLKGLLERRGIPTVEEAFSCRGKFLWMNRKSPTEDELRLAGEYAQRVAKPLA